MNLFLFLNWSLRPSCSFVADIDVSQRFHSSKGKLGFETMCYTGGKQYNNFYSRKSKKNLLRTKHTSTYDMDGRYGKLEPLKSITDYLELIKFYFEHHLRFDQRRLSKTSGDSYIISNTMQKYVSHSIKARTFNDIYSSEGGFIKKALSKVGSDTI